MADGKVIIEIDADSEGFESKLESIEKMSTKAASAIGKKTAATQKDTQAAQANADAATRSAEAVSSLNSKYDQFTAGITSVDKSLGQLQAELKLNSERIKGNESSVQLLKERHTLLQKALDASREKVQLLGNQLEVATELYGENSDEVADLRLELTNAKTQEAEIANQLKDTTEQLQKNTEAADQNTNAMKKSAEAMQTAGKRISEVGEKMAKVGTSMTKYVTTPVLAAGVAAVKFASDYEENLNKVDASFKDSAQTVKDWAKTATEQFGMSESAALEATSLFGDMGTSMGLTTKEAATMSTSLAGLAGDLASFKNIGIDRAMTALKGVFTGETESLKELGVVMTETNLKEFAKGLGLVYDEMDQTQRVTLRYQYVLANTKNAQGDYARTADGTANSMRTLKSSVENLGAAFGQELLPEITPVIQKATTLIKRFGDLDESTKQSVIHWGLLATSAGPVTAFFGKTTEGIGKAITGFGKLKEAVADTNLNFTGIAGPVGIATAAVLGFVGITGAIADAQNRANAEMQLASDSLSGIERRTREANAAYQESMSSINAEGDSVMRLANSLISLVESGDRSTETQTQIKSIVDQLNESVPNLGLAYDELTGKLNMTTDAILAMAEAEIARRKYEEMDGQLVTILEERAKAEERLAEAKEEQAAAQEAYNEANQEYLEHMNDAPGVVSEYKDALNNANEELQDAKDYTRDCQEAYDDLNGEAEDLASQMGELSDKEKKATEATKDNADALDEQADAAKEATQSVAKIALKAQDAVQSGKNLGDTYEDLRKELDDLKGSGDPYIESLAEQALKQLDAAATAQELRTEYSNLTEGIGVSAEAIASALAGAGMSAEEFASGCESMKDRVINGFEEIKVNEELTASQIAANLSNNLAVHEQWSGNLISLWNNTQDETVRAFILYLYDQGPELATAVDQFAHGGTEELLAAAADWAAIGDSTAQGYLARVAGQAELAGAYGTQLSDGALAGVNAEPFGTKGTEAGQVFASNITAQAPAVQAAASELAMTAHSAMAQVGWADLGSAVGTGISNGLTAQTGAVQTAAQTLAQSVSDAWTRSAAKFRQSGATAANMLRTGLTSQKSSVTSAGRSLADGVTSAWAQSSARFQSAGTAASAAIAGGISSGSGGITSAAASAASSAYSAVYGLGWYSLGYNISAGIASGVRGGSGLITSAARSAANAALRAAKSSLDIHSPSRVFEKQVGMMIPGGIAVGVQKGTPKAEKAVELSADQLLRATQIALRPSGSVSPAQSITNNTAYYGGGSGDGVLKAEAPVIIQLDSREIGRGTAKFTGQRMAYLGGLS